MHSHVSASFLIQFKFVYADMAAVAGAGGAGGNEGGDGDRQFVPGHNMYIVLDPDMRGIGNYREIINFLIRSRIFHAITNTLPISVPNIEDFWNTAVYDARAEPPVIRATVNNRAIQFSAEQIRVALQLGNENVDDPTEFPATFRDGAFLRMGYSGPLRDT